MIELDFLSWKKNPTPAPTVFRNPTTTAPKNLRLRNPVFHRFSQSLSANFGRQFATKIFYACEELWTE